MKGLIALVITVSLFHYYGFLAAVSFFYIVWHLDELSSEHKQLGEGLGEVFERVKRLTHEVLGRK